ncbi:MAG TPA: hypothetical protein VMX97_12625 [Hyphomicrobiaceae bacterium]|nr:hypothetical protein [Hyphomicrobiaceae bacterium]
MHEWTKEQAQIIKGVWSDNTGRLALTLIVERLAGLHTMSFDPANTFNTAFNEGRRSVGHDLMRAINTPLDKLVKDAPDESRRDRITTATERATAAALAGVTAKRRPSKR